MRVRQLQVKDFNFNYSNLLTGINLSLYGSHISRSIPFNIPWNLYRWGAIAGFPETSLEYVWDTCRYEHSELRCCNGHIWKRAQIIAKKSHMVSPFWYQQFLQWHTKLIQWKSMKSKLTSKWNREGIIDSTDFYASMVQKSYLSQVTRSLSQIISKVKSPLQISSSKNAT